LIPSFNTSLIDKVFSALVPPIPTMQELDILFSKETEPQDVTYYQTMLNKHFPPKSVFIFDAGLEQ